MRKNEEKEIKELVSTDYVAEKAEPIEWEVGRHYQGSFWLNEFGEIQVRARQEGTKPGNMRKVCEGENHVIYASNRLVRVVITMQRDTPQKLRSLFAQACTEAIIDINKHDFSKTKTKKIK